MLRLAIHMNNTITNEKEIYGIVDETLRWFLPFANLALGIFCIIYTLNK